MEFTDFDWDWHGGSRDHLVDILGKSGVIAHVCTEDEVSANEDEEALARLISATPNLYRAAICAEADICGLLERLQIARDDDSEPACKTLMELREAIARAKGRTVKSLWEY